MQSRNFVEERRQARSVNLVAPVRKIGSNLGFKGFISTSGDLSMRWVGVISSLLIVLSHGSASALPSNGGAVELSNLPTVLHEVISSHAGKRVIDEKVLISSHEKLFSAFDPQKLYLLDEEVAPFLDPQKGKVFLREYRQKDFSTYFSMINVCRKAVERSRTIRRGFFFTDSRSMDVIRHEPMPAYTYYPVDVDELTSRQFHHYMSLITERLPQDEEDDPEEVRNAVMLAERELEGHEASWLQLDTRPTASQERQALVARCILKAIVSALDAHSDILEGKSARSIRERLTKEALGTGIVSIVTDQGCFIKKVVRGSPADRLGGISEQDQIISINGHQCADMTASEIDEVLSQEAEGIVKLVLKKQGDQRKIEKDVARTRYTILEGRLEVQHRACPSGTILVLSLHSLYRGAGISSSNDVKQALEGAKTKGRLVGVVLDLRDNGGGYVTEAVRIVGEFIKTGVVMVVRYADGSRVVFRDLDNDILFSGPIVVLTSRATASAAEIVAQTLKDYGRAVIVGDYSTFGKGSIQMQTITDMTEKNLWVNLPLRLTIGRFYTVSGYSPQQTGVPSDIIVPGIYVPRKEEEPAGPAGQERVDPMYRDTLDDVRIDVRGWYREHYLPFLQEPTNRYRQWIPTLQRKSDKRVSQSPLHSLLTQRPTSTEDWETLKKNIQDLQLDEAVSIEGDLVQLSGTIGR
jgi:carboxyl-terminal processing protease